MDQMSNGSTCGCDGVNKGVCKPCKVVPMAILIAGIIFIFQGFGVFAGIPFTLVFGNLLVVIAWVKLSKVKCKC